MCHKFEHSTSNIYNEVHMNWGWDRSYDDWYSTPPAGWLIDTPGVDRLYNTEIGMVYNFLPDN